MARLAKRRDLRVCEKAWGGFVKMNAQALEMARGFEKIQDPGKAAIAAASANPSGRLASGALRSFNDESRSDVRVTLHHGERLMAQHGRNNA